MHWIRRAALAIAVGFIVQSCISIPLPGMGALPPPITPLQSFFIRVQVVHSLREILRRLLGVTVPLVVYIFLTRRYDKARPDDGETRCRHCQYILKGLTKPRCPECGEAI